MGKHTREYRVWDDTEEEALKAGVKKHGLGAWEIIRNDPEFAVLITRTGVQLKDKWRNLIKFRHISLDDKELVHVKAAQINKGEKQVSAKGSAKQAVIFNGSSMPQGSLRATDYRSGTATESVAYCDRASQKSTFRSSSRRKKPALAADFVLDVEEDDTEDLPECMPARSAKRQQLCPREDTRYGIYDQRRYALPQVSASDVSDSACLGKALDESNIIKCPCGSTDEELAMIQCEVCKCWAHSKCLKNLMVELPYVHRFDFSYFRCTLCQSAGLQRPCKRRTMSSLSVGSQSSEQDSRDSTSVFTTDCKSGTGDGFRKSVLMMNTIKVEAPLEPYQQVRLDLPKPPQKQRTKRPAKRRSGDTWCRWLFPEKNGGLQELSRCQNSAPSPFGAPTLHHQPSACSKMQDGVPFFSAPLGASVAFTSTKRASGRPKSLELSTSHGNSKAECEASPASVKTCHTAEFKIPVSVLCGDVAVRNNLLVLESDDEDGAVSSSHDNTGMEGPGPTAHIADAAAGILASHSEHELLSSASLDLPQERFSLEFLSRIGPTSPPQPSSLSSVNLDLPLPSLAASPFPTLSSSYPHFSAPLHTHPPLFNPMPAAFAAVLGKFESDASMLAHLPWMQALLGQQTWPLGLTSTAAAAAAAAAVVSAQPALELYKQGFAGASIPQSSLRLEPLSLDLTSRPSIIHTMGDAQHMPASSCVHGVGSASKNAMDQACDATLLPLLAELRSQTPDPGSFLNAPTPLPEMSLPLHLSGSCPLFDLPPLGVLPVSKTPPLPDLLLNVPSLCCPFPSSTEMSKLRPDDAGSTGFDFLHEFVNADGDEENKISSHMKEFPAQL